MNKYEEAKAAYERMREVWNSLAGSELTDPFEWKTCYHEEEDREPKLFRNIYVCTKCGFWIRALGVLETAEAP